MYRRITSGRYQHLAPPSKVATEKRLRFSGHVIRRPADRLVQGSVTHLYTQPERPAKAGLQTLCGVRFAPP
ncbi:hypothetical protein RB195_020243 [Necator americanus]|uniref:Uncharacterized protein n=1 Tax=Necator americanus TaxID=51031 RepID=A0ABR1CIV3_NECAM